MRNIYVDNNQAFDFGKTSKYYAKYRDIYPNELFEKLLSIGVGLRGTNWLDLGTGTGVLPRALARYGANIIATDISENQIIEARELSKDFDNIEYKICSAEKTELESDYFDAITACQCFWYFDHQLIIPEIKRMIRNGGVFVKIFMDWAEDDEIANASTSLIKKLNPNWNSGQAAMNDLREHYFDNPLNESFDVNILFTRETWHGRMLTCRGVKGSMNENTIKVFENEHTKILENYPKEFLIKHKVFIVSYKIKK